MNTENPNLKPLLSRRRLLSTAFVAGASGLLLPRVSGVAFAAEPTLQETLVWIQKTLAEYGDLDKSIYHPIIKNRLTSWTGVVITTTRVQEHAYEWARDEDTCTINLSQLTPEVERDDTSNSVILVTTDRRKVITRYYRQGENYHSGPHMESQCYLSVRDRDIRERLYKAFVHAITLAGGQKSGQKPNEPF